MTLFDYAVLFILLSSAFIGAVRGLLKEVLSLASWVIAFFVANAYGEKLAELIHWSEQSIRLIAAFVILFIGVRFLMWLLIMALDGVVDAIGLKLVDRGLGAVFGLIRGFIFVLACMLLCGLTDIPLQPFWKQALFRPILETTALAVKPYLPGTIAKHVKF